MLIIVAFSDKVPMAIKMSYIFHKGQPWKLVRIQNSILSDG